MHAIRRCGAADEHAHDVSSPPRCTHPTTAAAASPRQRHAPVCCTASTEHSRQRWVRSGFPPPQFATLYASLQQVRGIANPAPAPLPATSPTDTAAAPDDTPPTTGTTHASRPSSASSDALQLTPGISSAADAPAPGGGGGSAPSVAASAAQHLAATTGQVHVSMQPAPSAAMCAAASAAPVAAQQFRPQQTLAPAVGMFATHGLPVMVPDSVASTSAVVPGIAPEVASMTGVAGMTDPHMMQLYLQQLALGRSAAARPLRMPYAGGMTYVNAPVLSPHPGGYDGLQAAPGLSLSPQPSSRSMPLAHMPAVRGTDLQLHMNGTLQPAAAGSGAVLHGGMPRAGTAPHALASAAACGPRPLWPFPPQMTAAAMRPAAAGVAYAPLLLGAQGSGWPLPGLFDRASFACVPPSPPHAGAEVSSAFMQVAGFGLADLASASPPGPISFAYGCPPAL